ncbi:hypothetical protein BHE74_00057661, partial [Ensete ventricosum]
RDWFEPDRKSDFTTKLARQLGRLCELSRLGAVATLPHAGSPDSGPQATLFTKMLSDEPICLDLATEVEKSFGRYDERSRWLGSERCSAPEFSNGRSCDMGPPSSAKMIKEYLLCLPNRCGVPPCLLSWHCWFRPVCASPPAVASAQSWRSGRGKGFSSGRLLIPTRRSGRVGSRRNPSDGQVSLVVDFAILLLRRGAGAFIVIVTGYPYLKLLSSLLLTIPLHLTTLSVVLAARRAPAAGGC